MTTDKTPATLATVKHGGCVQLGDWLMPCPFCGARAERIDFGPGSGDNEGGSCVACTVCQHSGPVEFGYKENFISNWNRRALSAQPSPGGQGDARAQFETWAASRRYSILRHTHQPDQYMVEEVGYMWRAWQAALAARQPVAPTLQQISDYLHGLGEIKRAVIEREALAARQPVGEPVAVVGADFGLFWFGTGPIAPLVERHGLKPGSQLYAAPPAQAVDLGTGVQAIACERERQLRVEGFSPACDAHYIEGELARAATAYAQLAAMDLQVGTRSHIASHEPPFFWPWAPEWWKPVDARRDLVRAGALIAAQIDLIDSQAVGNG